MKKASEYRQHSIECRHLAAGVQGAQRDQLVEIAATWDRLADDRAELIRRHPELTLVSEKTPAAAAAG